MSVQSAGLDGARLKALRELKGLRTQQALADIVCVPQSHICDLEKGKLRNAGVFVRVADELDCTTDFLLRRGPFKHADQPSELRDAASRMAFDVFSSNLDISQQRRELCRRVIGHRAAPLTADAWVDLSEQIEMAVGPGEGGVKFRKVDAFAK